MKQFAFLLLIIIFSISCENEQDIEIGDVLIALNSDKENIEADGSSTVRITCEINPNATIDRREVKFEISSGKFVGADGNYLIKKSEFIEGRLLAIIDVQAPMSGTEIKISAQPNLPDLKNNYYILNHTIALSKSTPSTLTLNSDASTVKTGYRKEVFITALFSNSTGKKVSLGNNADFKDVWEDGSPANGIFRILNKSSDIESTIKIAYSIGETPIQESKVKIIGTVLNDNGSHSSIIDSLFLTIINKD